MELLFEDYQSLVWSCAHKRSRLTGRDVEDLYSSGCRAYMDAVKSWNKKDESAKNSIKFSTFLYHMIKFEYDNEGLRNRRRTRVQNEAAAEFAFHYEQTNGKPDVERTVIFRNEIANLSEDAAEVVKVVYNSPEEFTRLTKTAIAAFFKKQGWTPSRTENAFQEIKAILV